MAKAITVFKKLDNEITLAKESNNSIFPYTIAFSNWINSFEKYETTLFESKNTKSGRSNFGVRRGVRTVIRTRDGQSVLIDEIGVGDGENKKTAYEQAFKQLSEKILVMDKAFSFTQMDVVDTNDLIPVGTITSEQVSEKTGNVILEVAAEADSDQGQGCNFNRERQLASTEDEYQLVKEESNLMNRWYPFENFTIKTDTTDIFGHKIPEALYKDNNSINLLPLRGFLYGDFDIEFKIVINAAPFHAGRAIFGLFYCAQGYNDTYGVVDRFNIDSQHPNVLNEFLYKTNKSQIFDINGMLQRPHVICDFAKSTTGVLEANFCFNKSYVRVLDFDKNSSVNPGTLGSYYVYLNGKILSSLITGDDQPKAISGTIFYRFKKANLTGMTKTHTLTQMDMIAGAAMAGVGSGIFKFVERQLLRVGNRVVNQDKPNTVFNNIVTVPRPRLHQTHGIGLSDAIVMSIDPRVLTTHYDLGSGPKCYEDLARIPGIAHRLFWQVGDTTNKIIFSRKVQPYVDIHATKPIVDSIFQVNTVDSLPLHIAANGFMNWGGTIIYEFDIVKTDYHKGTIMISINFGKGKEGGGSSTYEKIVDIQETSNIKVTVPYIYDTVCRRLPNTPYFTTVPDIQAWNDLCLPNFSQTTIDIKVINPLINIANVGKKVEILVWKYAGEDFFLNSICQVNNTALDTGIGNSDFPNSDEVDTSNINSINKYVDYNWTDTSLLTRNDIKKTEKKKNNSQEIFNKLTFTVDQSGYYKDNKGRFWDEQKENYLVDNKWVKKESLTQANLANYYSYQTQMDSERDFKAGPVDPYRLKSGDETNFKNILRMPVRILANRLIKPEFMFYIPVCPLTSSLIGHIDDSRAGQLSFTHQYQILKMFRLWRGGMRYVIVARGTHPIWITYLPSSGVIKCGLEYKSNSERIIASRANKLKIPMFYGKAGGNDFDPTMGSNYTTMILPSLNPSEIVEVPWNLPVNWAFTNQSSTQRLRAFREIGDLVNGHLVIYSDAECEIDVLMSVGDDFDLTAFCGITDNIPMMQRLTRLDDARFKTETGFKSKNYKIIEGKYETQMDFQKDNHNSNDMIISNVQADWEFLKEYCTPQTLYLAGSVLLPSPLCDISRFLSVKNLVQKVDTIVDTSNSVKGVCSDIKQITLPSIDENILKPSGKILKPIATVVNKTENLVTQGGDMIDSIVSYIKSLFPFSFDILGMAENFYEITTELIYSLMNGHVLNFATSFLSICQKLQLLTSDWVKNKAFEFGACLGRIFGSFTQGDFDSNSLEEHGKTGLVLEDQKTLIGLLFGGVLTTFGTYTSGWWQKGYTWFVADYITLFTAGRGLMTMNASITFVRNIFGCVSRIIEMVLGIENDEVRIRSMLSNKSAVVDNFVRNAHEFLNNFNDPSMSNLSIKNKHWLTVCNAYQLQACIIKLGISSVGNVLINLCKDVIRKANDNCSLFQATAVRYEPFVICLEGEPGIGKSFLTGELSVMILDNLNIKTNSIDIKYTVNPGVNYWNLYNGQPIIVYDDWANFTDEISSVKEFSELFQLKTSNTMNAPKAELAEKKTVVNPFAVILCTNNPFPVSNALHSKQALYRRRDVVVKCRAKNGVNTYDNYAHLEFCFYTDSINAKLTEQWLDYESFTEEIRAMHTIYHNKESENVKKRLKILNKALKNEALISDNLHDPFTLQARSLANLEKEEIGSNCSTEYLEMQVAQLVELVNADFSVVNITKDKVTLKGSKLPGNKIYDMPITQGLYEQISEFGKDYICLPMIKTYETLSKLISDWMYMGLRCTNCSSVCGEDWILKRCISCKKNYCSRCAKINDEKVVCTDCNCNLELVGLPWLDLIIGFISCAAWHFVGVSQTTYMINSLVKFFLGYDFILPSLIIKYAIKILNLRNKSNKGEDIIITSETQMPPVSPGNVKFRVEQPFQKNQDKESLVQIVQGLKKKNGKLETMSEDDKKLWEVYEGKLEFIPKVTSNFCKHSLLMSTPDALYTNSKWSINKDELIRHEVCTNFPDCAFREMNDILFKFIIKHNENYGDIYTSLVKNLESGKIGEKDFENKVPSFYWPNWYVTSSEKEEIANITSKDWVNKLSEFVPDWMKSALKVLGTCAILTVCYKVSKKIFSLISDILYYVFGWNNATQVNYEYDEEGKRVLKKSRRVRKGLSQTNGMDNENQYYKNVVDKILGNYVRIKIDDYKELIGLGICGSKILIPKHYVYPLKKASEVVVSFSGCKHEKLKVNLRNLKIKEFSDRDLAIIEISSAIYFKDIRKFFLTQEDFENFTDSELLMIIPRNTGDLEEIDLQVKGFLGEHTAFDKLSNKYFTSSNVIEYDFQEKGVCGSVLFRCNGQRPLVGIHVAGTELDNTGVGVTFTQKDFETNEIDLPTFPFMLNDDVLDFGEDVNVEYIGKIDTNLIPHMPIKTDIVHSNINRYFEENNEVAPAILSSKDERYLHSRSPLICGVRKHGKPTIDFDCKYVNRAFEFWKCMFLTLPFSFDHEPRVYDMKGAALGKPELADYYDNLPDNTSAGWPWNVVEKMIEGQKVRATKKKHWMKYIRNEQLQPIDVEFDELLIETYDNEMEKRRLGVMAPIVFQDVLKDEKRKIEKLLKEGGTRVFSMSPITASIAMRAYTLDFTSWIRKNRISNWIAVGISCDGPEWGRLAKFLLSKSNNIFSIDFSNFGPGLNVGVAEKFGDLVNAFNEKHMKCYSATEKRVLEVMIKELLYSMHLAGGTVYRTKSGSPSGAAITVEMNSFVHLMYVLIVWQIIGEIMIELYKSQTGAKQDTDFLEFYEPFIAIMRKNGLSAKSFVNKMKLDDFGENVIGQVYGDDGIFAVSDEYKEIFNAETIQAVLISHGIVATDATKKENIVSYDKLENITFLKRGFQPHPKFSGQWLAPIEDVSIKECARWIHKTFDVKGRTRENVEASLLLAYGKGEDWYNLWKEKVNDMLSKEKMKIIHLSWEEIDKIFFTDYYVVNIGNELTEHRFKQLTKEIDYYYE